MSKIRGELQKATGLAPKDGEDEAKFRARLVRAVSELPDDKWAAVSAPAQTWVNNGIEQMNAKKPVSDFPDANNAPPTPKRAAPPKDEDDDEDEASAPKAAPKAAAKSDDDEDEAPAPKAAPKAAAKSDDDEDDDEPEVVAPPKKAAPKAVAPKEEDVEDEPAPKAKPAAKAEAPKAEEAEEAPAAKPKKKSAGRAYRRAMLQNPGKSLDELHGMVTADGFEISKNTAYITFYETRQTLEVLAAMSDKDVLAAVHAFKKAD